MLVAKTYVKLGNKVKAKKILDELVAKNLLKEQAEKILKEIK
jgi:hypothetical protein